MKILLKQLCYTFAIIFILIDSVLNIFFNFYPKIQLLKQKITYKTAFINQRFY